MAKLLIRIGLSVVILFAVIFQVYLKEAVWLGFGIGRTMQPLSDFPFTCRKIVDPHMEACEDMWLSQSTRQLFLACSDPFARKQWMPHVGSLNISGRSQRDSIVKLEIDKPVDDGFRLQTLQTPGFSGTSGDGLLSLAGFTSIDNSDGGIDLLLVNMRPSVDPASGNLLSQHVHGGNSTIEHFVLDTGAADLKHVHTYADQGIITPNRVAALDARTFYISNDHGPHKFGWRHHMCMILGYANINFCEANGCKEVASRMKFPNGLALKSDILYVPDSITGRLSIYRILPNKDLKKIDEVNLGYGIDNVSIDENDDIWVAAFPVGVEIFKASEDPYGARPPAAVLRVGKVNGKYEFDKVIEDAEGEVLPAATTVVHDAKTGRLFLSKSAQRREESEEQMMVRWKSFACKTTGLPTAQIEEEFNATVTAGFFDSIPSTERIVEFENVVTAASHHRRLFVISRGSFGLGPSETKVRDSICILLGAPVPFVLKKKDGFVLNNEWEVKPDNFIRDFIVKHSDTSSSWR